MRTWLQSLPGWVRLIALGLALLALNLSAQRAGDEGLAWAVAAIAVIAVGALGWETASVVRRRGESVGRADAVRTWLRAQSRTLAVLGALALGLCAVFAIAALAE